VPRDNVFGSAFASQIRYEIDIPVDFEDHGAQVRP
jgi:hypothetical protein